MGQDDDTRRLQIEAARFEALLETARDAIVSIDPSGRITLFNRAAVEIFGFLADEVVGQNVSILMASPYRDEHDAYLDRYHRTEEPRAIGRIRRVDGRRKDGEIFPLELSVSEARVGNEVLYTAILRDVSERERAQKELLATRQAAARRERLADIGALAAKIVHDVGNPLAGLSMSAQSVLRRIEREPEAAIERAKQPVERILATVLRLNALITEFKQFLQEQRLEMTEIDLPRFVEDVIASWGPEAEERGIALEAAPVPAAARMRGDVGKLRRVLDNLVKNALEAIERGPGSIGIEVESVEGRIGLTITDTGPGLPSDVDPFALFETTKADGSGLGLPIVEQIVTAHGGRIEAESRSPHGTCFRLDLPVQGPGSQP